MGESSKRFVGAMTLIDEIAGTYLVSFGETLRLYFEGNLYAPDSDIPPALTDGATHPGNARRYVESQLTRRLGPNVGRWPLTARFFLAEQPDTGLMAERFNVKSQSGQLFL